MKNMAKMKFEDHDPIVILTHGGEDYIQEVEDAGSSFQLYPGGSTVSPNKELWEADGDTECTVSNSDYIRDELSTHFLKIVGSRPRNLVQR